MWRDCVFVLCRTGNNTYSIKKKFCIDTDVTQRICKQLEAIEFIQLRILSYNKTKLDALNNPEEGIS